MIFLHITTYVRVCTRRLPTRREISRTLEACGPSVRAGRVRTRGRRTRRIISRRLIAIITGVKLLHVTVIVAAAAGEKTRRTRQPGNGGRAASPGVSRTGENSAAPDDAVTHTHTAHDAGAAPARYTAREATNLCVCVCARSSARDAPPSWAACVCAHTVHVICVSRCRRWRLPTAVWIIVGGPPRSRRWQARARFIRLPNRGCRFNFFAFPPDNRPAASSLTRTTCARTNTRCRPYRCRRHLSSLLLPRRNGSVYADAVVATRGSRDRSLSVFATRTVGIGPGSEHFRRTVSDQTIKLGSASVFLKPRKRFYVRWWPIRGFRIELYNGMAEYVQPSFWARTLRAIFDGPAYRRLHNNAVLRTNTKLFRFAMRFECSTWYAYASRV